MEDRLPELDLVFSESKNVVKLVTDCDAIVSISGYGQPPLKLLRSAKKLRWVHSTSAGVETIVRIPALRGSDIILTNAKIIQGPEIADHVFAMLLFHTRNLKQYNQAMEDG